MPSKKTVVDDMIDEVKSAATTIGEAVGVTEPKLHERIVPIPQVNVYSELPFALVEKYGKRVAATAKGSKPAAKPNKAAAAAAKSASKTKSPKAKKTSTKR